MEKENTHKPKYCFHRAIYSQKQNYLNSLYGYVDTDTYGFTYYCYSKDDYLFIKESLDIEMEKLFLDELSCITDKYPILINHKRTKEQFSKFKEEIDYEALINEISNIFYEINPNKYPTIYRILYESKYDDEKYNNYIINKEFIKKKLYFKIDGYLEYNYNLKKLFKIKKKEEADYIKRSYLYESKSVSYKENKSRKWRKRNETDRRRKDRRENKKLLEN